MALTTDQYQVEGDKGVYLSRCFFDARESVRIEYSAGYDPVPFSVQQAVCDLVSSRYYNIGGDPSRIVRAESVPDVANVSYLSSVYYQADFDPILGQYGSVLDPYRSEAALGFQAEQTASDMVCP